MKGKSQSPQAKGGRARAKALSPTQRSAQASAAARARWDKEPGPVAQVLDAPLPEPDAPPEPPSWTVTADDAGEAQRPRTRDEFLAEFLALGRAIDNVLVAHHGLRHSLKTPHPPFHLPMTDALRHYGPGPLFALWCECQAVEQLRIAWTGK